MEATPQRSDTPGVDEPGSVWRSLWQAATRFEKEKVSPWVALRNTLGVTIPLAAGVLLRSNQSGLTAGIGALNVAFSDNSDPYLLRAGRMIAASTLVGVAVFTGALASSLPWLDFGVTTTWAFAAGLLVALDAAAADIGLLSLVTYLIFSSQPMQPELAVLSGALAFSGGLLQTALALALWPVKRYEPERKVLGELYLELARIAMSPYSAVNAPPGSPQLASARTALSALGMFRTIQGERYLLLLTQAERIRLSILTLARLSRRLQREPAGAGHSARLDAGLGVAAQVLQAIGEALSRGRYPEAAVELEQIKTARTLPDGPAMDEQTQALLSDAAVQHDALAGQLRAAIELAASSTIQGRVAFERREASLPFSLRLAGTLATLRANLTHRSAAFRHGVRLALCVAIAELLSHRVPFERSYWLPMTAALVLKPDFTATFSRGLLRFTGTFAGLLIATLSFQLLAPSAAVEIALISVFAFVLRCYGPANYGIVAVAISGLVVMIFGLTGVAPARVVADRAVHTLLGGAVALIVYAVWPTWERHQINERMATLLDRYREYFRAVKSSYIEGDEAHAESLDLARREARLARSNLEASVERLKAEPRLSLEAPAPPAAGRTEPRTRVQPLRGHPPSGAFSSKTFGHIQGILASSHRFVHAVMALESGLSTSRPVPARTAFHVFANHVELTLHSLAGALRGSPVKRSELPDLRADHDRLLGSGNSAVERYALVNVEADRITNSLNTLTGQVLHWTSGHHGED